MDRKLKLLLMSMLFSMTFVSNASNLAPKLIRDAVESLNLHCPDGYQPIISFYERPEIQVNYFDPSIMAIESTEIHRIGCGQSELPLGEQHCMLVECTQPISETGQ